MKRSRLVISGLVLACLIATSGSVIVKAKQVTDYNTKMQEALRNNNYDEANIIYDKITENVVISKVLGCQEKTTGLLKESFQSLKNNYLADSISYEEFNSKVEALEKFDFFKVDKSEMQNIAEIEKERAIFRKAEVAATEKNYKAALEELNSIESNIDPLYKNKLNNLKTQIQNSFSKEMDAQLEKCITDKTYEKAITLLEEKKGLLSEDYINENINKFNFLIKKLNDEEILKKEQEEEAVKAVDAKVAKYLTGYVANPEKEKVVLSFSSGTNFLVWVDLSSQETNVFVGTKGSWKLIRSFTSSTGKAGDETPTGTYTIQKRGKWFFSEKYQEGAEYWVEFWGNYLFHSLPMNRNHQVVDPTLGVAASHGCVRLDIDNAAWIYNNIPNGTKVYIK